MNAYLVRLKDHLANPHDLVGIFFASSVNDLTELVDECCDTFECEYRTLPRGGLYVGRKAKPVPFGDLPETREVCFFHNASFTDDWLDPFLNDAESAWRSLGECPWSSLEERQVLITSGMDRLIAAYPLHEGKPPSEA